MIRVNATVERISVGRHPQEVDVELEYTPDHAGLCSVTIYERLTDAQGETFTESATLTAEQFIELARHIATKANDEELEKLTSPVALAPVEEC